MEGKASQVLGDSDGWLNSFLKIHNKQYMYHIAHSAIKSHAVSRNDIYSTYALLGTYCIAGNF